MKKIILILIPSAILLSLILISFQRTEEMGAFLLLFGLPIIIIYSFTVLSKKTLLREKSEGGVWRFAIFISSLTTVLAIIGFAINEVFYFIYFNTAYKILMFICILNILFLIIYLIKNAKRFDSYFPIEYYLVSVPVLIILYTFFVSRFVPRSDFQRLTKTSTQLYEHHRTNEKLDIEMKTHLDTLYSMQNKLVEISGGLDVNGNLVYGHKKDPASTLLIRMRGLTVLKMIAEDLGYSSYQDYWLNEDYIYSMTTSEAYYRMEIMIVHILNYENGG